MTFSNSPNNITPTFFEKFNQVWEARLKLSKLFVAGFQILMVCLFFVAASAAPLVAQAKVITNYAGQTTKFFEASIQLGAGAPPETILGGIVSTGNGTFAITSTPYCGPSTTACSINASFHARFVGLYAAEFVIYMPYASPPVYTYFHREGISVCPYPKGSSCVTTPKAPKFYLRTKAATLGVRG